MPRTAVLLCFLVFVAGACGGGNDGGGGATGDDAGTTRGAPADETTAEATYRTVVAKHGSYWLRVEGTAKRPRAWFWIRDGEDWYGTTANIPLATGTTYHLVGTYDGTTLRIYVDGVERGTQERTGGLDDTRHALQIASSGDDAWHGRIDEVAVYDHALASDDVDGHFRSRSPRTFRSLVLSNSPVAYWRLAEASGRSAADASGNRNGATYEGSPTLGAPGLMGGGDTSVQFDGTGQRVVAPDSETLSPTAAVSVEAWINADSLPVAPP